MSVLDFELKLPLKDLPFLRNHSLALFFASFVTHSALIHIQLSLKQ